MSSEGGGRPRFELSDEDLKEIFGLFSSPSKYERDQIYDPHSIHFFPRQNLADEYPLDMEKREFAIDSWRAVLAFLHKRGYSLFKDGRTYDLSFIEDYFVG